jgi:Response receiver domain
VPTQTFPQQVESIVADFLHTVVVVDDEALEETPGPKPRAGAITEIPGRPSDEGELTLEANTVAGEPAAERKAATEKTADDLRNVHDLDPKAIIDSFARQGLVCSVLSPRAGENVEDTVLPCVERADLVIFDWVLNEDEGRTARELIATMIAKEAGRPRLRTIAIYTGQDNLADIAEQLEQTLADTDLGAELEKDETGLTLTKGPVRITVLAKSEVQLPDHLKERAVQITKLPGVLTAEFAALSTGLVSAVALAALSALRSDTHRVLRALPPDLDPSYLGTRAAQPEPPDSEEVLVGLVSAEIRSVLDDHLVGEQADQGAIRRWITHQRERGVELGEITVQGGSNLKIDDKGLLWILEKGLGDDERLKATVERLDGISEKALKKIKRNATVLFTPKVTLAQRSDALLSQLMAVRTHYRHPQRTLQLGTLIAYESEILVCVQPLCDGVRLKKARAFPFLAIAKVTPAKGADFMFKARGQTDPLRLRIDVNPSGLRMYDFTPTLKGVVVAAEADGSHTFTSEGNPPATLVWLGQLKPEFAQKVATDLAHAFGRIGLDEHELMRLSRSGE